MTLMLLSEVKMILNYKENRIKILVNLLLCAFLLNLFCGCATSYGSRFDMGKVEELSIGQSTKDDVERLLGQPYGKVKSKVYDVTYVYTYNQLSVASTIIHFPADIFQGGPRYSEFNVVYIDFDSEGIVRDIEKRIKE